MMESYAYHAELARRAGIGQLVSTLVWSIILVAGLVVVITWAEARERQIRNPSNDVIVACLQKERMPAYGVGPAGPPVSGKPLTAEMFSVICVEEK
jgi:hypothetical protein